MSDLSVEIILCLEQRRGEGKELKLITHCGELVAFTRIVHLISRASQAAGAVGPSCT